MNYQQEQDKIIDGLEYTPSLLLHSCCGPCSSYCLEVLSRHFNVTVLWYNPNIQPESEYVLRLENQRKLIENLKTLNHVKIIECNYDPNEFFDVTKGMENEREGGIRCTECFLLRLENTVRVAKAQGYDYFTTTLTVSPHKNAPLINGIGYSLSEQYGVKFLPSDFKKKNGYKRSIELSKEFELYRQDYCGCIFSKNR
jgi:predicted adenine nucleotide alpha hydrolase (AANH) superfamily ATPase